MIKTNFKKLEPTKHMLKWLSEDPYNEILTIIEDMFIKQVPSTKITAFNVVSEPNWLNGGKKDENNMMVIKRSGLAFLCEFVLKNDQGTYPLKGVFSWVAVNLDTANADYQQWFDLDGTLQEFGSDGLLKERIYFELS